MADLARGTDFKSKTITGNLQNRTRRLTSLGEMQGSMFPRMWQIQMNIRRIASAPLPLRRTGAVSYTPRH